MSVAALLSCSSKEPIRIGYIASLGGVMSELGVSGRNGARIAVESINQKGGVLGRRLELTVLDDGNEPDKTREQAAFLKGQGVTFIVGPLTSAAAAGLVDTFKDQNLLILSPTVTMGTAYGLDDSLILFLPPNKRQGIKLAELALSRGKKAAVLIEETNAAYTNGVFAGFTEAFEKGGGTLSTVLRYRTSTSITVSRTLTAALMDGLPDSLVSIGPAPESATLVQYAQVLKPGIPVLCSTWSMTNDLIQLSGADSSAVRVLGFVDPYSTAASYVDFSDRFKSMFGGDPSFSATLSHDAITVLANAISRSKSLKPKDIKKALLGNSGSGLQGPVTFDEYGDPNQPILVFKIVNGAFLLAGE